jgi:hypothetical protein
MRTYTTLPFDYDVGEYQVIGTAEICIHDNGDGSGRTFKDLKIEEIVIDRILDEDSQDVQLSPEKMDDVEDQVSYRIQNSEFDLDNL